MEFRDFKKHSTLHICQLIGIFLLCVIIILLSFDYTVSWFKDNSVSSTGAPEIAVVGTIDIDVTTNFNFYNIVLAPDTTYYEDQDGNDIHTFVKTTYDKNNIHAVYVRIKFTTNRSELKLVFDSTKLTTATTWSSSLVNKWVYNSADNYYYYLGGVNDDGTEFNAGYRTDNTFTNNKANLAVQIKFEVEAIQRPYGAYSALWTTAPKIFNDFALADTSYPQS